MKRLQPAGYEALIADLDLRVMPHDRASFIASTGGRRVERGGRQEVHVYPRSYAPGDGPLPQLEFALKYDGVNLEILVAAFAHLDPADLTQWIRARPTGKYTRRVWFFYEWLTNQALDVPDATRGTYVDALDRDCYHTAEPQPSRRHRVRDNLLGGPRFCPTVRRTEKLASAADKRLAERVHRIVDDYEPAILHRAAQFLYLKETKSSYEIERDQPDRKRTLRFVELLRAAPQVRSLDSRTLVELQNAIVDPRYADAGYRDDQNYVGQTLLGYRERIHFVPPKPTDVPDLMEGLLACHDRLAASSVDPVVWAAAIAFGFVFVHPFQDGNGRLHRFLVHHVLSRTGFTPTGLILPISAVMLADPLGYDSCLQQFSEPLLARLDYDLGPEGRMTVHTDSTGFYRYFDATPMAEYLYDVVERTIDTDFVGELDFLRRYDAAWRELVEIVDMPDRRLELFIRLCLQNGGRLSARKRGTFAELSDDEVAAMEDVVQEVLADDPGA